MAEAVRVDADPGKPEALPVINDLAPDTDAGVFVVLVGDGDAAMCRVGVSGWVSVTAHQRWVFSMVER